MKVKYNGEIQEKFIDYNNQYKLLPDSIKEVFDKFNNNKPITEEQHTMLENRLGKDFLYNYKKLKNCLSSTRGQVLNKYLKKVFEELLPETYDVESEKTPAEKEMMFKNYFKYLPLADITVYINEQGNNKFKKFPRFTPIKTKELLDLYISKIKITTKELESPLNTYKKFQKDKFNMDLKYLDICEYFDKKKTDINMMFNTDLKMDEDRIRDLSSTGLFSHVDIHKLKIDLIIRKKKSLNSPTYLIEAKNREYSQLQLKDIWSSIYYSILGNKIDTNNPLELIYHGELSNKVAENIKLIETNYKRYSSGKLTLKSFDQFTQEKFLEYNSLPNSKKINYWYNRIDIDRKLTKNNTFNTTNKYTFSYDSTLPEDVLNIFFNFPVNTIKSQLSKTKIIMFKDYKAVHVINKKKEEFDLKKGQILYVPSAFYNQIEHLKICEKAGKEDESERLQHLLA